MPRNSNTRKKCFWAWLIQMNIAKSKKRNASAQTEVWRNLVLIEAKDADEAFRKAVKIGKSESGDCDGTLRLYGKPATTQFLGVADMGLVYDELGDGAEILWYLQKCSQKTARSLVPPKGRLLSRLKKDTWYPKG